MKLRNRLDNGRALVIPPGEEVEVYESEVWLDPDEEYKRIDVYRVEAFDFSEEEDLPEVGDLPGYGRGQVGTLAMTDGIGEDPEPDPEPEPEPIPGIDDREDDEEITGFEFVDDPEGELIRACRYCDSSQLRERSTKRPRFICKDCRREFDDPTIRMARSYRPTKERTKD